MYKIHNPPLSATHDLGLFSFLQVKMLASLHLQPNKKEMQITTWSHTNLCRLGEGEGEGGGGREEEGFGRT